MRWKEKEREGARERMTRADSISEMNFSTDGRKKSLTHTNTHSEREPEMEWKSLSLSNILGYSSCVLSLRQRDKTVCAQM